LAQVVMMDGQEQQAAYDLNKEFMERMAAEAARSMGDSKAAAVAVALSSSEL
jgi:hypothetical protein